MEISLQIGRSPPPVVQLKLYGGVIILLFVD